MLTIMNNTTGEVVKIDHENKEGLKLAKDILLKWLFALHDVKITNYFENDNPSG